MAAGETQMAMQDTGTRIVISREMSVRRRGSRCVLIDLNERLVGPSIRRNQSDQEQLTTRVLMNEVTILF